MDLVRFDLAGFSIANLSVLQPGVTFDFASGNLVNLTIPNKYLNAENNGVRIQFPSFAGGIEYFFADSSNQCTLSTSGGSISSAIRVRAHDYFNVDMGVVENFTIDFGLESIDVLSGTLGNLTIVDQYLFDGGYRGDPDIPKIDGSTVISFRTLVDGTPVTAFADGILISAFRLPKPVNFWRNKRFCEEYAVYKDDVLP